MINDVSAVAAPGSVWVLQFLDPSEGPAADTLQAKHGLTEGEARKALTENGGQSKAKLFVSLSLFVFTQSLFMSIHCLCKICCFMLFSFW